jgi:hypothetical protein
MGVSRSKEVRARQQKEAEERVARRQEQLAKQGISQPAELGKDPVLRKLKAELRKANNRLSALEARGHHVQKVLEEKKNKGKSKAQSGKSAKGKKAQPDAAKPAKKKEKKGK